MKVQKVNNSAYPKYCPIMRRTRFILTLLTTFDNRQTVKFHAFTTSHHAEINANTIHS